MRGGRYFASGDDYRWIQKSSDYEHVWSDVYVAIGESAMNEKIITALLGLAAVLVGQAVPPPATAQQAPAAPKPIPMGNLNLENASLNAVIDQLAQRLKLNLIVDPTVKGSITLNTYGDTSTIDPRNLLEMILRINGFGLVQDGELYRVIPLKAITHMPLHPEINQKNIADDDQTILNLVFLKYVGVDELTKVLAEFSGENSQMIPYAPANLLFLLDSRRNMRRTMELIAQFDSDIFANQRVRLYDVKNVKAERRGQRSREHFQVDFPGCEDVAGAVYRGGPHQYADRGRAESGCVRKYRGLAEEAGCTGENHRRYDR